jgi:hypothetical protein
MNWTEVTDEQLDNSLSRLREEQARGATGGESLKPLQRSKQSKTRESFGGRLLGPTLSGGVEPCELPRL